MVRTRCRPCFIIVFNNTMSINPPVEKTCVDWFYSQKTKGLTKGLNGNKINICF